MRKLALFTTLLILFISVPHTTVSAEFRVDYNVKDTVFYDGVRHTFMEGTITYNGTETKQKINYLGANPTTFSDLNIVTGDNYLRLKPTFVTLKYFLQDWATIVP